MLLGSWARPGPACRRVLDVGTGTGVLALMVAQKLLLQHQPQQHDMEQGGLSQPLGNEVRGGAEGGSGSSSSRGAAAATAQPQGRAVAITAIDVCANAVQQARDNAAGTPWGAHVRVLHCSLQEVVQGRGRQEVALCAGDGEEQPCSQQEQQRHGEARQRECGELASSRAVKVEQEEEHLYDMIITNPPYFVGSSKPADVSHACPLDMNVQTA